MALRSAFVAFGVISAVCLAGCHAASTSTPSATRRTSSPGATSVSPPVSLTPAPTPTCVTVRGALPPPQVLSLALTDSSHVRIGRAVPALGCEGVIPDGGGQVMASTDGGVTWHEQYHGPVVPVVMQFVDDAHGWIAGCGDPAYAEQPCTATVLLTTDGGTTWTEGAAYPGRRIVQMAFVSATDGWVLLNESCQQNCPKGNARLIATSDGGTTWHDVTLPEAGPTLALQRAGAMHGWVLTAHHVLSTSDAGATWSMTDEPCARGPEPGYELSDRVGVLDFVDELHGWIGCQGGAANGMASKGIYATSDGGRTWQLVAYSYYGALTPQAGIGDLTLDGGVTSLFFVDDLDGWMATEGRASVVLHTNDGGHTWSGVNVGVTPIPHIAFVSANDGWAWGDIYLIHTTDGGAHWRQVAIP